MFRKIEVTEPGTHSMTALLAQNSAAFSGQNLQEDTVNFLVDTTTGPVTLILPEGLGLTNINVKFYVTDIKGNGATHGITIAAASVADTVNGGASVLINTAFGNAWITGTGALKANITTSFAWITTFGGAASSSTGGVSGISALTNGLTLTGSTGYLGGPLIQNTTISGLSSYYLQFINADSTFQLAYGNLASLGATDKCLNVLSTTANQEFNLSVLKDNKIALNNSDATSNIVRTISLISTTAGQAASPTGSITLQEKWTGTGYNYGISVVSQTINIGIFNTALTAPNQQPSQILLDSTKILCYKYLDSTNQNSLVNGWVMNTSPDISAMFWHSSHAAFGGAPDGNIIQLDANGLSFIVSTSVVFKISPTGQPTLVIPSSSAGLTSGMVYRSSSAPGATVLIV